MKSEQAVLPNPCLEEEEDYFLPYFCLSFLVLNYSLSLPHFYTLCNYYYYYYYYY
jgi:hypothetical protein